MCRVRRTSAYGEFEYGFPSHHTISRVVASINPKQSQKCFIEWM
ncbi:transposase family protein [Endozoicomonas sp. SESOKO2]